LSQQLQEERNVYSTRHRYEKHLAPLGAEYSSMSLLKELEKYSCLQSYKHFAPNSAELILTLLANALRVIRVCFRAFA
jgi:hypothetical protein